MSDIYIFHTWRINIYQYALPETVSKKLPETLQDGTSYQLPQQKVTAYYANANQNTHTPTSVYDQLNRNSYTSPSVYDQLDPLNMHSGNGPLTDNDFANDGYSVAFSPSSSAHPNSSDSYAYYLSSTEGGIASTELSLAGIYNSAASIPSFSIEGKWRNSSKVVIYFSDDTVGLMTVFVIPHKVIDVVLK